jgi:iron(III) transport system ATP-binding protein
VVLLDEPFSNLDVEVRLRLRSELPAVLSRCGASGLIVTHDPEEALAICDRVAVLRDGVLHQCASPRELVQQPATAFVGRFALQGNLLPAEQQGDRIHTALGCLIASPGEASLATGTSEPSPEPLEVLISPEVIQLRPDPDGQAWVQGREFLGREWLYQVQLDHLKLRLRLPLDAEYNRGVRCQLSLRPGAPGVLFPSRVPLKVLAAPQP